MSSFNFRRFLITARHSYPIISHLTPSTDFDRSSPGKYSRRPLNKTIFRDIRKDSNFFRLRRLFVMLFKFYSRMSQEWAGRIESLKKECCLCAEYKVFNLFRLKHQRWQRVINDPRCPIIEKRFIGIFP